MKKLLLILLLFISIVSCQSSKLGKKAQKQLELTLQQLTDNSSKSSLSNLETVYNDDSLCIIHADYKKESGNDICAKIEYIMVYHNKKYYEGLHEINVQGREAVYLTPKEYEKEKQGKIYGKLSYESALYYLSTVFLNFQGREVGAKTDEPLNLPTPTSTGLWTIQPRFDEFGDTIKGKPYLILKNKIPFGQLGDQNKLTFGLVAYVGEDGDGSDIVDLNVVGSKGDLLSPTVDRVVRAKTSDGKIYEMKWTEFGIEESNLLRKITESENVVSFFLAPSNEANDSESHTFKMNLAGYKKAREYVLSIKKDSYSSYIRANASFIEKISKNPAYKQIGGIYYKILKQGKGIVPKENSMVKVHYEARTIDAEYFESSYKRKDPVEMRANLVIKGWTEALTHMSVGSIWEVVIPNELAYGQRELGKIKPFSTLIFKIELLK